MTKEDDVRAAQRAVSKAETAYNRIKLDFRSTREEIDIAHEALVDAGMELQRATKALQTASHLSRPMVTESNVAEMMLNPAVRKLAEKLQGLKVVAFECNQDWDVVQLRLDEMLATATVNIFDCIDELAKAIKREHFRETMRHLEEARNDESAT